MRFAIPILFTFAFLSVQAQEARKAGDLRSRLTLHVQTLITSADGKRIEYIDASHGNYRLQSKRGDISSMWMSNPEGFLPVRLDFTLKVNEDKSVSLAITQYKAVQFDTLTGNMTKKDKGRSEVYSLADFNSISWESESSSKGRVVTRFTPMFADDSDPLKLTYSPLSLSNLLISDNSGEVWQEGSSAAGEVVKFENWKGTLFVSFVEFKGSTELGTAKEGLIEMKLSDKLTVRIRSEKPILGAGITAKVYGWYSPKRKTVSRIADSIGATSSARAAEEIAKLQ